MMQGDNQRAIVRQLLGPKADQYFAIQDRRQAAMQPQQPAQLPGWLNPPQYQAIQQRRADVMNRPQQTMMGNLFSDNPRAMQAMQRGRGFGGR